MQGQVRQGCRLRQEVRRRSSQPRSTSTPRSRLQAEGRADGPGAEEAARPRPRWELLRRRADHAGRRPAVALRGVGGQLVQYPQGPRPGGGDDSIKAVVLRVNSPGGSAVASEIILDATHRVKARKPFVVSMGDVAGSGGYYVTCTSDVIFADETTITASIGVVGGKLATAEMWKKVGVTFKTYQRGENAGLLASARIHRWRTRRGFRTGWTRSTRSSRGTSRRSAAAGSRSRSMSSPAGGSSRAGRPLELGLVDKIGRLADAIG